MSCIIANFSAQGATSLKVHQMINKQKIELETVSFEWEKRLDDHEPRQQIVGESVQAIVNSYVDKEQAFGLEVPPRCGKSNVIYATAYELWNRFGTLSLCVAPWTTLASQLASEQKIKDHFEHYKTKKLSPFVCGRVDVGNPSWMVDSKDSQGNPTFLGVSTIAMLYLHQRSALNSFSCAYDWSGTRPVLFIDEAQLLQDEKPWGKLFSELVKRNVYVVVATGTPFRSDGKRVSGFQYQEVASSKGMQVRLGKSYIADDGKLKRQKTKSKYSKTSLEIQPDRRVSWANAFAVGALCKSNVVWVDASVTIQDEQTKELIVDNEKLSDMSSSHVSQHLRKIIEQPSIIREACKRTIDRFTVAEKEFSPHKPRWIVMVGSDTDLQGGENKTAINRHGRAIQKELKQCLFSIGRDDVNVRIATVANQDSEPENLVAFREGRIDILIVKMMGVVGLDIPEIAGCTMLSTLRDGPTWYQFVTRCMTQLKGKEKLGTLVMLKDQQSIDRWADIQNCGGEAADKSSVDISTEEIEASKQTFSVNADEALTDGYCDHEQLVANGNYEPLIRWARENLQCSITDPQIIKFFHNGVLVPPANLLGEIMSPDLQTDDSPQIVDPHKEANSYREDINQCSSSWASMRYNYEHFPKEWVKTRKDFMSKIKKACGVNPKVSLQQIADVSRLSAIASKAKEALSNAA